MCFSATFQYIILTFLFIPVVLSYLAHRLYLTFVRYSSVQGRKEGETTSTELGYLYSGKEGDSRPNNQA